MCITKVQNKLAALTWRTLIVILVNIKLDRYPIMPKLECAIDVQLAVVENTETGLFHGAVYRNYPSPSCLDRWLLSITLNEGFLSPRKAAIAVNTAFPDIQPLELPAISEDDLISMNLPIGALITWMTPNRKHLPPSYPEIVEVREFNSIHAPLLDTHITPRQVSLMERNKLVLHESSSGEDPDLYYRYDHYIVVRNDA